MLILRTQSRANGEPELGSFTPRKVFLKGEALEIVGSENESDCDTHNSMSQAEGVFSCWIWLLSIRT